jgi:hypothetical protein
MDSKVDAMLQGSSWQGCHAYQPAYQEYNKVFGRTVYKYELPVDAVSAVRLLPVQNAATLILYTWIIWSAQGL